MICNDLQVGDDTSSNRRELNFRSWGLSIKPAKSLQWIPLLARCSLVATLLALLFLDCGCRKAEPPQEVRKGAFVSIFGSPNRTPTHASPYPSLEFVDLRSLLSFPPVFGRWAPRTRRSMPGRPLLFIAAKENRVASAKPPDTIVRGTHPSKIAKGGAASVCDCDDNLKSKAGPAPRRNIQVDETVTYVFGIGFASGQKVSNCVP